MDSFAMKFKSLSTTPDKPKCEDRLLSLNKSKPSECAFSSSFKDAKERTLNWTFASTFSILKNSEMNLRDGSQLSKETFTTNSSADKSTDTSLRTKPSNSLFVSRFKLDAKKKCQNELNMQPDNMNASAAQIQTVTYIPGLTSSEISTLSPPLEGARFTTNESSQCDTIEHTSKSTFASRFSFSPQQDCQSDAVLQPDGFHSSIKKSQTEAQIQENQLTAPLIQMPPHTKAQATGEKSDISVSETPQPNGKSAFASRFKVAQDHDTGSLEMGTNHLRSDKIRNNSCVKSNLSTQTLKPASNFASNFSFMRETPHQSETKPQTAFKGLSFLENCRFHKEGKSKVKRILAELAKKSTQPYGVQLLLEANKVIDVIESFHVNGKTMLQYFLYVVRFLKDMEKKKYLPARKAVDVLQRYKIVNYQHFARMPSDGPKPSLKRTLLVNSYKDLFERNLLTLKDSMAKMKKPISLTRKSKLSRDWMRMAGFLTLWLQEEIGYTYCHKMFTRDTLFHATPTPGKHMYEIICKGPKGDVKRTMTARLHECLIHYSCMRSWRLPKNGHFLIGLSGCPILPKNQNRYIPKFNSNA